LGGPPSGAGGAGSVFDVGSWGEPASFRASGAAEGGEEGRGAGGGWSEPGADDSESVDSEPAEWGEEARSGALAGSYSYSFNTLPLQSRVPRRRVARATTWAESGAVNMTKAAIAPRRMMEETSVSWKAAPTRRQASPRVDAFAEACIRKKVSGKRTIPTAASSAKMAPTSRKKAVRISERITAGSPSPRTRSRRPYPGSRPGRSRWRRRAGTAARCPRRRRR